MNMSLLLALVFFSCLLLVAGFLSKYILFVKDFFVGKILHKAVPINGSGPTYIPRVMYASRVVQEPAIIHFSKSSLDHLTPREEHDDVSLQEVEAMPEYPYGAVYGHCKDGQIPAPCKEIEGVATEEAATAFTRQEVVALMRYFFSDTAAEMAACFEEQPEYYVVSRS